MYKFILFAFIALLTACNQDSKNTFTTNDAWVREAPPNASMMAGYVTLKNNTDQDSFITYVKSKQFNMVEVHRTIVVDGVAKMRRQDDLPIPAGSSLKLEPGSYHLMLMGPKSALKLNDEITVTLGMKLEDKIEDIDIVMPIKKQLTKN